MGSLLCIIPLNDESKLIRGELLPDSTGPVFVHGWIETVFEGREYVVDVAMGRAIPKEEYYRKLRPRVDAVVTRKELSKNEYVQFLSKALYRENRLDLESVYTVWQPYEDDYLIDIDDNGMLIREQFEKPVQVRSRFIDQTEG